MSILLLFFAIAAAPPLTAEQPQQARLCSDGFRGSSQIAYKPYGSSVFGSDGIMCASVKSRASNLTTPKRPQQPAVRTATTGPRVETGP
jgi:hypothetical protein